MEANAYLKTKERERERNSVKNPSDDAPRK